MSKMALIAAGLAATLITGCTSVAATSANSAPAGVNQPGNPKGAKSGANDTAANDGTAKFGKAFTWADGLSLTVGKPTSYKPSEWAIGADKYSKFVVLDVRIVNKTGKAWDPSLVSATIQSSNKEGEQVYDSGKLPERPNTKLLNGREVKYKIAFGVADPKDLVLEVAPDWEHDSVIFTS